MTVVSDHPMWLAEATGGYAVALPDEDLESLGQLAGTFDTTWIVVIDKRGRYPAALLDERARGCLADEPMPLGVSGKEAWLFVLADDCVGT